ncbi:hypothetical protein BDR26DRAFT_863307 [Obelidium mucronatum]|nr:hypothetical protein BDR26DRAFT_863307 [Obelidium mucronatum]
MSVAETLTVKVGASATRLQIACPNDEENPIHIKNDHFEGDVLVRVKNFRGVVPDDSKVIATVPYFEGRKRLMSFQFQGRFAKEWTGDDLVWSQDWDLPLAAPKMIGLFQKFYQMTDAGSYSDINAEKPYMRSYVVTAMCTITSWKPVVPPGEIDEEPFRPMLVENVNGLLAADVLSKRTNPESKIPLTSQLSNLSFSVPPSGPGTPVISDEPEEMSELGPTAEEIAAASAGGPATPEPTRSSSFFRRNTNSQPTPAQLQQALAKEIKLIEKIQQGGEESVKDRRKYFSLEENRKDTIFKPELVYGFEVFNPFFDPNEFKIKIPGITIDLSKVTNGQPMRLRLMSKDGSTVFFTVEVSVAQPEAPVPGSVAAEEKEKGTLGKLWGRFSK